MKHLKTFETHKEWFDYPSDNRIVQAKGDILETTVYNVSHVSDREAFKRESYNNIEDAYNRATRGYSSNEYCIYETKCRVLLNEEVDVLLNTNKFNL